MNFIHTHVTLCLNGNEIKGARLASQKNKLNCVAEIHRKKTVLHIIWSNTSPRSYDILFFIIKPHDAICTKKKIN